MCLAVKTDSTPICATEFITCYKGYVLNWTSIKDIFISPYRGARMPKINKVCRTIFERENRTGKITYGFHSFKNLEDAKEILKKHLPDDTTFIIVECEIPMYSLYYEGIFGNVDCYCSNEIIITKIVEKNVLLRLLYRILISTSHYLYKGKYYN